MSKLKAQGRAGRGNRQALSGRGGGMILYHFTDTARLPWILDSGELRPGRNAIGGYPDPDFLWATESANGDGTASGGRDGYRSGRVRMVRISLNAKDFFPWACVPERHPAWTHDHIVRLERSAQGKSSPGNWWCRGGRLPLGSVRSIDTRSWNGFGWEPLPLPVELSRHDDGALGIKIGGKIFTSLAVPGGGVAAYAVGIEAE
jgi:hypothetical protein